MRPLTKLLLVIICAASATALYFFFRPAGRESDRSQPNSSAPSSASQVPQAGESRTSISNPAQSTMPTASVPAVNPSTLPPSPIPPATPFLLGSADTPPAMEPAIVLSNMRIVIHQYGSMFGGNPVGTNPEITAALNGDNPRQAKFINPESGL